MPPLTTVADRIDQLALDLRHHKPLYYSGEAAISDAEDDALEGEFRGLLSAHLELVPADNPLGEVGAELPVELYAGARPEVPVLSLEKVPTDADARGAT